MTSERLCDIPGCGKPYEAKGWCVAHYSRWRRYGDPLVTKHDRDHPPGCSVEGCGGEYLAAGLCNMHYQRKRKTGTTDARPKPTRTLCSVEGCHRWIASGDLCGLHHHRMQAHGTTDDTRPTAEDRFMAFVDKAENGCWLWTGNIIKPRGNRPNGYGRFWWNGLSWNAHRAAWALFRGPIPDGMTIDHLCFNPPCVNPDHLEPVTLSENMRRAWARKKGHVAP